MLPDFFPSRSAILASTSRDGPLDRREPIDRGSKWCIPQGLCSAFLTLVRRRRVRNPLVLLRFPVVEEVRPSKPPFLSLTPTCLARLNLLYRRSPKNAFIDSIRTKFTTISLEPFSGKFGVRNLVENPSGREQEERRSRITRDQPLSPPLFLCFPSALQIFEAGVFRASRRVSSRLVAV